MSQALPIDVQCAHPAPAREDSARRLGLALALTAGVTVSAAVGGYLAHSLALLADAGHMLADVGALGLALFVSRVAQRPATPQRTYGLLRLEILAALVNGAALVGIAVGIGIEAWHRIQSPPEVRGGLVIVFAGVALAANVTSARILHHGHDHSLNQRGAYLHVLSDVLGSLAALVSGAIVLATGYALADPIVSVAIGLLILGGAWRLVKESADVLLEATPGHIALSDVHNCLVSLPGVSSVHDLHVWTLTSGMVAMSGHLVVRDPAENQRVLEAAQERLVGLGIQHVTIQIEKDPTCD